MNIRIEHIKEPAKQLADLAAAGTHTGLFVYYVGYVAEVFDKLVNPILAGIGLILSIAWTIRRLTK